MAGDGGRGGSGSSEGSALGCQLLTCRGATGAKEVAHTRGGLEVKRDGGLPAAATVARCGGLERRGWCEGRRNTAALYRAHARG
jgi:CDGSH-type Zn-finger protein